MRTKPVIVIVVLAALAAALAWWLREPATVDAPAVDAEVDAEVIDDAGARPVLEALELPPLAPSPQGLYDDLEAAAERSRQKPDIEYERLDAPTLAPPARADEDEEQDDGGG